MEVHTEEKVDTKMDKIINLDEYCNDCKNCEYHKKQEYVESQAGGIRTINFIGAFRSGKNEGGYKRI